jgi:hypothetical protein
VYLLVQDSFFPFSIRSLLLKFSFKLLALLALFIKLRLGIILLSLQALRQLFDLLLQLLTVHLDPILVLLQSFFMLRIQLFFHKVLILNLLLDQCRILDAISLLSI